MEKLPRRILYDDKLLAKFTVFAELGGDELHTLLEQSAVETYSKGELIIHSGEVGHCMYVILRGSVRVTVPDSGQIELARLSVGDFFGEVALVDDGPRSANVIATDVCELLCITRTTLGVLAGLHPDAAIQLLAAIGRSLVARLRKGNQKYIDLLLSGGPSS
jgi:CRP/FNR family transcriptional regulator, cyclic AMP receptor protein